MTDISNILRENNLKVTPQRIAIFNILYNTNKHPSAESIYKELILTYPSISLATVYKTLKIYKKHNLIKEINIGEDSFRYDIKVINHPHIICIKCKSISDLESLNIKEYIADSILKDYEFLPIHEEIYIYGLCKNCNK